MADALWRDYALEVVVNYTAPPTAVQELCIDGTFVGSGEVASEFKGSNAVVGTTLAVELGAGFTLGNELTGRVRECDD